MNIDYHKDYSQAFYQKHVSGMSDSASVILGMMYRLYHPQSVIDVGCGQGAWLKTAESFGATRLKGLDGDWIKQDNLLSRNIDFTPVNFDRTFPALNEKFDLCISLEVAEHISERNAENFVDLLCQASDTVLFGAAIKYQGGTNHINEQWQSYWIDKFKARAYQCFDCIRGQVWDNEAVEWWYRQNAFLFIGPNNVSVDTEILKTLQMPMLNVAHPINYENKIHDFRHQIDNPTFRFWAGCAKRWLSNKLVKP